MPRQFSSLKNVVGTCNACFVVSASRSVRLMPVAPSISRLNAQALPVADMNCTSVPAMIVNGCNPPLILSDEAPTKQNEVMFWCSCGVIMGA